HLSGEIETSKGLPVKHRPAVICRVAAARMARHVSSDLFPTVRTTPLPGGYMGKLLRVDLTTGTCTDVNLPEEPLLRKLWGGQALASYILLHELPLGAKALEPENVIVTMTGPLTGTGLTPGGTKSCS